jgi:7-keto-8-aminopelargonate synthetase-like enzyme
MKEIILQSAVGAEIIIEGKKCLYFGGTNYLGMANRPEVISAARSALERFGLSSSASRSTSGTTELHLALESAICSFAGSEDAVLICSGYMSMCALLETVAGKDDLILVQGAAHPSIWMAVRVSGLPYMEVDPFDPDQFSQVLREVDGKKGRLLVVAEGVTPLTGRLLPLPELLDRLEGKDALFLLDEAHAFGVLGNRGRGTAEHFGIDDHRIMTCTTLSKAFGSSGGVIPGSRRLVDQVRKFSKVYLASTPPPAPVLGAARAALEYAANNSGMIECLRVNTERLKKGVAELGLPVDPTPVPIIPICFGDSGKLESLSGRLLEMGILAPYGNYPGSPDGGLVRITVSAAHTTEQIDYLLDCLKKVL